MSLKGPSSHGEYQPDHSDIRDGCADGHGHRVVSPCPPGPGACLFSRGHSCRAFLGCGARAGASDSIFIPTAGTGKIAALREGMDAASNELLVVLDPHRAYTPQAIVEVIEGLLISDADFAIAVPRRDRHRSWWRTLARCCLGAVSQLTLGTSDLFSGLIAIRPGRLRAATNLHHARGSRLVLDLLAWPMTAHRDVPVETRPNDRLHIGPLRFDDIRQLKRLLDHRFGTMSRLVQFCMVVPPEWSSTSRFTPCSSCSSLASGVSPQVHRRPGSPGPWRRLGAGDFYGHGLELHAQSPPDLQ